MPPVDRATPDVAKPGDFLGQSDWVRVTQDMINRFGAVTLDPDPMHDDPEWAAAHSPFGGPIAYGFLTLSLLTHLLYGAIGRREASAPRIDGAFLNYGLDGVRLIEPIRAEARVRGTFTLKAVRTDAKERRIATIACTLEIERASRPALVGDWITIWLPPQ
jgi:acyl dehydratase